MKKQQIIKMTCWCLIILIPLSELLVGYDSSDIGFILNQYKFINADYNTIYLPLLLTDVIGSVFLNIFKCFSMPEYLCFEVLWALCIYYLCFLSYKVYKKYYENELILPALVIAVIFAKTNLNFFMYNTTVAVFSLTALYFFVIAVNDRKNIYLVISVFFLCLSVLSKLSAAIQIVMYLTLFYDFYIKKDRKHFSRQILSCLAGGAAGIVICGIIISASCGMSEYFGMIRDMFIYAGNSGDGHTVKNMLLINIKGVMHGVIWLGIAFCLVCLSHIKPLAKLTKPAGIGLIIIVSVYTVVGFFAAGISENVLTLYQSTWKFFEVIAIVTALMYICVFLIMKNKEYTHEYKILVLSAALITCSMPIGSNVGIRHICNESFFVIPFIAVAIRNTVFSGKVKATTDIKKYIVLSFMIYMAAVSLKQSFYRSCYYQENGIKIAADENIPQLRYIKSDQSEYELLEELLAFLSEKEYDRAVVAGNFPIINYLSGIKPGIDSCGGWIETDYVTATDIETDLYNYMPVIITFDSGYSVDTEKNRTIKNFINSNKYMEVFHNEKFTVYSFEK